MAVVVPTRTISGGRELRLYAGYWFIRLTPAEKADYPGGSWSGYVLFHKFKWWLRYGEWFGQHEARYMYLDGNPDNIRITNIGVREIGTGEWL